MIFKHSKTGVLFESSNENLFSALIREGYEAVEAHESTEDGNLTRKQLVAKAQELGIKSPVTMKTDALIEEIKKAEI